MIEHKSPISGIAAVDGKYVATAGYDNQVILWDAVSGQSIARGVHDHLSNQVRFSRCGRYLVSSSSDRSARLWSVPTMRLLHVFAGHDDDVEAVALHPSEELLATASRDSKARVFRFDGTLIATMVGHGADVISVEWTADGQGLVTSSDDGTVKRWDARSGRLVEDIDLGGVETDTIVVDASGMIFAGNDDGEIVVIHGGTTRKVEAHRSGIKRLVYNAARRMLVSLSYDRKVRIWSAAADGGLTSVGTSDLPTVIWPRSCAFVDEDRIAFATFGTTYATLALKDLKWDVAGVDATPGVNAALALDGGIYTVGDAGRVCRDGVFVREVPSLCNLLCRIGDRILTAGQTGQIFDAVTGEVLHQHRSPINCAAAFVRDGLRHAIFGAYTGEGVVLVERADGRVEHLTDVRLHENAVKGVTTDGESIFSVCATGALAVHRVADFGVATQLERAHDKIANGCAVVSRGRFASISRDLKLRIWDAAGATVVDTPHTFSIKCIAANTTGDVVATGSYGGQVAFYQISTGLWLKGVRPTACGISSLVWDDTRGMFLASSYDGHVYELAPTESAATGAA